MHSDNPGRTRSRLHLAARRDTSLGQGMAEFSLVLPVILLLTLIAIDFGRVYLGWINLQNMSRIAANYAANDAEAWGSSPDSTSQERYRNQILADAAATNCHLPVVAGEEVVPAPTFTDVNANGIGLGDTVRVQLTCTFDVITPLISSIVGGSVNVTSEASFPVKSGLSALVVPGEPGGGSGGGSAPNAAFSANNVFTPGTISGSTPFTVEFRDTSGGSPTTWYWDFDDGTYSSLQDPLHHTFPCTDASCTFDVRLTVSNINGSDSETMPVTVYGTTTVDFTSDGQSGTAPYTVRFTDASTAGATAWAWNFGDGATGTGSTVNHTYSSATGSPYSVTLTVTYPTGSQSITKAGYITVGVGICTVPNLGGRKFNDATAIWQGSPNNFTGTVLAAAGSHGNFVINTQSLTANSTAPCNSSVTVSK